MTINSSKMQEAIRVGCTAADVHLRCSYPDCSCKQIPKAVEAAVTFALRDAASDFKKFAVAEIKARLPA